MDELPNKVTDIDVIRIMAGEGKKCYCLAPRLLLKRDTRTVYCQQCGAQMDAFAALEKLANRWQFVHAQVEQLLDERRKLLDWHPHRVAVKAIHDALTHKASQNLIPVCPHCHEGIEYAELTREWIDREFARQRRDRNAQDVPADLAWTCAPHVVEALRKKRPVVAPWPFRDLRPKLGVRLLCQSADQRAEATVHGLKPEPENGELMITLWLV